ncbi:uncharacterized protein I303_102859 [Kwoniella dejecticola CBS 10117]|uniref:Uncharacterized protein n=1 Tax=Kwoniella dejecticola CBS 10117 TaxID=1296121 RepID=A0A1A6A9X6_9TREE|nr:uncharacterized protein I303_02877 [Kwoniella dejecticola CBS 10117]OBR86858.1 hypothetical protein I303_02877 [Kwoniella dejecticola CBS 10117]
MILNWFLRGPAHVTVNRRGGSGEGITTTRAVSVTYGAGPPASTETKWRGIGNEPNIAGSTGGFIGLIAGIVIVLIISTFIGIYLWNRYRKRLPPKKGSRSSMVNPLPSLSFSRPSTSDPYAQSASREFEMDQDVELDLGETPKASKFSFNRPVYTRQRSSEWELPVEEPLSARYDDADRNARNDNGKDKGKGKGREHVDVDLPSQPDEVALPLRTKSPRPISPSANHDPRVRSGSINSMSSIGSTPSKRTIRHEGNDKGRGTAEMQEFGSSRMINPFENPYDESRLSPIPLRRADSVTSFDSTASDVAKADTRRFQDGTPTGSSGGEDSDRSVRVSQIREGSRFVERFESKESLT